MISQLLFLSFGHLILVSFDFAVKSIAICWARLRNQLIAAIDDAFGALRPWNKQLGGPDGRVPISLCDLMLRDIIF